MTIPPEVYARRANPPAFNVPGAVLALIVAILVVHGVVSNLSDAMQNEIVVLFGLLPGRFTEVPGHPDLVFPGGLAGELFSLISYTFLHGSWAHVLVNAVWLLAFGTPVARRVGSVRFLLFYFACGIVGGLLHVWLNAGSLIPVIGASAAISGMMGGAARFVFLADGPLGGLSGAPYASSAPRAQTSIGRALTDRRVLIFAGVWIGLNLLFGPTGINPTGENVSVAWEAHLGGFLAGLFFFGLFDPYRTSPSGGPGNVGYGEWSGRNKLS